MISLFLRSLLIFWLFGVSPFQAANPSPQYTLQIGTPVYLPAFIQPEAGCNWTGVGGQVFNQRGAPVAGLVVVVRGTLDGQNVLEYALTGASVQLGQGGFDIKLASKLTESQGSLTLELQDITGKVLAPAQAFDTRGLCGQNLTLVNLVEQSKIYWCPFLPRQR